MLRGLMQLMVIVILYIIYRDGTIERVDELTPQEEAVARERYADEQARKAAGLPRVTHTVEDVLSLYGDDDDAPPND